MQASVALIAAAARAMRLAQAQTPELAEPIGPRPWANGPFSTSSESRKPSNAPSYRFWLHARAKPSRKPTRPTSHGLVRAPGAILCADWQGIPSRP